MTVLAIFVSLLLDRTFEFHKEAKWLPWFDSYVDFWLDRLKHPFWAGWPTLLVIASLPILVVAIVQGVASEALFGLPGIVLSVLVLLVCLGPLDLYQVVDQYIDARENDELDTASRLAQQILPDGPSYNLAPESADLVRALFYQANEQVFGVIFWFTLFGPFGAVVHRLSAQLTLSESLRFRAPARTVAVGRQLFGLLDWLPARLLALCYALVGNFQTALDRFRGLRSLPQDLLDSNRLLLAEIGNAALQANEAASFSRAAERNGMNATLTVRSARALVLRSAVVWLAVLVIITLARWWG